MDEFKNVMILLAKKKKPGDVSLLESDAISLRTALFVSALTEECG